MFNMFKSKRGQFAFDPKMLIITLVTIGLVGAIGLLILSNVQTSGGFTGAAAGALGNITTSIANFFAMTPVLGTIFVAVLLLGAVGLVAYAVYKRNN